MDTPNKDRNPAETPARNFIQQIIDEDNRTGKHQGRVCTRFPPEPNGYLHVGHAKSICLNFGLAREYGGQCNLRFDDTNPVKEELEYINSIQEDVRWLGFQWDGLYYASDYFGQLSEWAEQLIRAGKAYVCDLSADEVSATRGSLTQHGKESPYRNRSVEENLDLFRRMKAGEFADGARSLRARIDMASPNLNLRDPIMYRILKARTTAPATPGASTPPTTGPTASPTPSRRSPTRSARWSSRTTARCTSGTSRRWASTRRSRSSSPGST